MRKITTSPSFRLRANLAEGEKNKKGNKLISLYPRNVVLLVHRDRTINRLMVKRKQLRFISLLSRSFIHSFILSGIGMLNENNSIGSFRCKYGNNEGCSNRFQGEISTAVNDPRLNFRAWNLHSKCFQACSRSFSLQICWKFILRLIESLCSSLNKHYRFGLIHRKVLNCSEDLRKKFVYCQKLFLDLLTFFPMRAFFPLCSLHRRWSIFN